MEINWKKKYNEALERARALREEAIEKEYVNDYVKDYEAIFPELAESEDERIRKHIIEILERLAPCHWDGNEKSKCIAYLEKQKPEWSEEDEVMLNNIIWNVHMKSIKPLDEMDDRRKYEKYENFLKSIPTRFNLQPKQEWSDEDELMRNAVIQTLETFKGRGTTEMQIDWLKSLRPQPSWKPSEEQMGVFGRIVNDLKIKMVGVTIKEHRTLESLYNDIKKLM